MLVFPVASLPFCLQMVGYFLINKYAILIYHVVQGLWAFSLTTISRTDAQERFVHLKRMSSPHASG